MSPEEGTAAPEDLDTGGGVMTERSITVVDGLPASPKGLLDIAKAFEGECYFRLARYLRACADQMTASPATTISPCTVWSVATTAQDSSTDVFFTAPPSAAERIRKGQRYALVLLPTVAPAANAQEGERHGL